MLVRSGIRLVKLWFSVSRAEQRTRFVIRQVDPVRSGSSRRPTSPSLDKWDDYTEAKEAMFFYTDTADAPWTVVKSNDKKRARLEAMRHVLSLFDYDEQGSRAGRPPGSADRRSRGHPARARRGRHAPLPAAWRTTEAARRHGARPQTSSRLTTCCLLQAQERVVAPPDAHDAVLALDVVDVLQRLGDLVLALVVAVHQLVGRHLTPHPSGLRSFRSVQDVPTFSPSAALRASPTTCSVHQRERLLP